MVFKILLQFLLQFQFKFLNHLIVKIIKSKENNSLKKLITDLNNSSNRIFRKLQNDYQTVINHRSVYITAG